MGPPTDVDDGIGANDDLAVNAMDTSGEFTCQLPFPLTNAGVGINGTRVSSVTRDMAGFHHGIQEGDELVSIGGMKVGSRLDVGNAFGCFQIASHGSFTAGSFHIWQLDCDKTQLARGAHF